ncbi:protein GRAVITROPIC IN THE LIGHT 1-like [Primulina eburnea]|uniref:protein GRAVITROPIC IN THE LIGHT 1-like n=1 Tax=Primulina eburnea TaxID=1245227 RepID=UPI003C6BF0CB
MFLRSFRSRQDPREKQANGSCEMSEDMEEEWRQYVGAVPFNRDIPPTKHSKLSFRSHTNSLDRSRRGLKKSMAMKVSNLSHIIQRITASCLLHPHHSGISTDGCDYQSEEEEGFSISNHWEKSLNNNKEELPKMMEIQLLMGQVFDGVTAMKRAYVSLQEAHFSWDPERMRVADVAVVAEIQRLGLLRERFRGSFRGTETLREMVAPYEEAVEDLKREVKVKQEEVDTLTEKLKTTTYASSARPKCRFKRRVSCTSQVAVAAAPELFEATMSSVKEASRCFASLLLSLMHSARWDICAVVRSIEATSSATANTSTLTDSAVGANYSKYAIESYVNKKIFLGFSHEDFYMDETQLSSMIHPDKSRRDCFAQYRDIKAMDPLDLLNVLPTCSFGKFCIKKYLSIMHPKMEESLLGDLEHRRQLLHGEHPRSQFYGKFLELSKAVWLLHLLAFSLDPAPSHFETSRWAEFQSEYMESVVRISGSDRSAKVGVSLVVGFQVSPGFKLANGSMVKARVFLIPKN